MKGSERKFRFMIAGGGTGGHVFPAIAIANALSELCPGSEFLFVGARGRLEMERVPAAGYAVEGLPMLGMPRGGRPLQLVRFALRWLRSYRRARALVRAFAPDAIVGVGGYASVPVVQAGQRAGVLTVIQEQNGYAGRANRMLARRAARVYVAYPRMARYFPGEKIRELGNPIRTSVRRVAIPRAEACAQLGLPASARVVLVMGGSLGALSLNEAVLQHLEALRGMRDTLILLQAGRRHYAAVRAAADAAGLPNLVVVDFIERMDCAYAAADVIVSRAGAIAISELCVVGKPLILVPSPNVAEDHQTHNAEALARCGAAILLPDAAVRARLLATVADLMADPERMAQQRAALTAMARPDAALRIAEDIVALLEA